VETFESILWEKGKFFAGSYTDNNDTQIIKIINYNTNYSQYSHYFG